MLEVGELSWVTRIRAARRRVVLWRIMKARFRLWRGVRYGSEWWSDSASLRSAYFVLSADAMLGLASVFVVEGCDK